MEKILKQEIIKMLWKTILSELDSEDLNVYFWLSMLDLFISIIAVSFFLFSFS